MAVSFTCFSLWLNTWSAWGALCLLTSAPVAVKQVSVCHSGKCWPVDLKLVEIMSLVPSLRASLLTFPSSPSSSHFAAYWRW